MLRGMVVAVEPDKRATIVVNGQQRTVLWADIDKVERGKYKASAPSTAAADAPAPAAPAPAAAAEPPSPAPAPGAPRVHIEANRPNVEIVRVEPGVPVMSDRGPVTGTVVHPVCKAPCGEVVDGRDGAQFYFAAPGMVSSRTFGLADKSGDVTARIKGGSAARRYGGLAMTIGGGASTLTGGVFLIAGSAMTGDPAEAAKGERLMTAGGIVLGVGAALLVPGIVLLTTNRTSFELVPATPTSTGVRFEGGRIVF
ncbi:hypothetical protein [Polyangium aurulentum]|uniref:hypothetical protein n=1 Tax=Polyangium aurulentum TaxID=2567896 RepID=UPI00200F3AA6|nr:hypothetical protein [Polyangium aurulentum]UQA55119.1 hypothetical protein E8A73_027645 [Polyangium aurulentum]